MEDLSKRMEGMMERLMKEEMRPRQKEAYMCSARCCDTARSTQELEKCTARCAGEMERANHVMVSHVEQFQRRMERCSARCHDSATAALGPAPEKAEVDGAQKSYEGCVNQCAREMIEMLPKLSEHILSDLGSRSKPNTKLG
mmetsp:Transcript_12561/g.27379  ORF Transcript_12561/g.27379 Transcript_12561/m.27379 type:complete len:142 (-) Transcript_12561:67-492(-)